MQPLLNLSNTHLFWQGKEPVPLAGLHAPSFLAWPRGDERLDDARARLQAAVDAAAGNDPGDDDLAKVLSVGEPVRYHSFWDHDRSRDVLPVAAKRSYWVPEVSDRLFWDHGFYTAEHDVPYMERALADLGAEKDLWLWDTQGRPADLSVLTYDIETTQYGSGKKEIPIDVIGYADFGVSYEASKDLETEAFDFRFRDLDQDFLGKEVVQLVSHDEDEELDHLMQFTQHAVRHDVIAGHNVLGFDNL